MKNTTHVKRTIPSQLMWFCLIQFRTSHAIHQLKRAVIPILEWNIQLWQIIETVWHNTTCTVWKNSLFYLYSIKKFGFPFIGTTQTFETHVSVSLCWRLWVDKWGWKLCTLCQWSTFFTLSVEKKLLSTVGHCKMNSDRIGVWFLDIDISIDIDIYIYQ